MYVQFFIFDFLCASNKTPRITAKFYSRPDRSINHMARWICIADLGAQIPDMTKRRTLFRTPSTNQLILGIVPSYVFSTITYILDRISFIKRVHQLDIQILKYIYFKLIT